MYAIYIFAFILILLILLVIFLIFVLLRPKFLEVCKKNRNDSENTNNEMESAKNLRQGTHQRSMKLSLNKSHSFEFKNKSGQYQVLKENDSTSTLKSTKEEFSSLQTPTKTDASGNVSPRIVKNLVKDMPIILPEQMSQICKEVLTRTNRNDDSSNSLRNIDKITKGRKVLQENEKKYASSPVLDVIDGNEMTSDVEHSNKEDFDNKTKICSSDKRDMQNNLKEENLTNETPMENCSIYDMPKELEISQRIDLCTQTQVNSDDMYDLPKQIINCNKENVDCTQSLSDIYDMPKELFDSAQINYFKPHLPQNNEDIIMQGLKKIDKTDATVEPNAYDFPTNSQMEAKMYINANCIH